MATRTPEAARTAVGRPSGGVGGRRMTGWDSVRAWRFIRASKAYRAAWHRRRPQPGLLEPAPFEIRWQTAADAGALRWGLHAWANPDPVLGPRSPFWARAAMVDGRVERNASPLAALAAADQATLAGLRIGGDLILKIERDGAAVQTVLVPGVVHVELRRSTGDCRGC